MKLCNLTLIVILTVPCALLAQEPTVAVFRTDNFIVVAPDEQWAKNIGAEAERVRKSIAIQWFDKELPPWSKPCWLRIKRGLEPRGVTHTNFDSEGVTLSIDIRDGESEILEGTLPHEITHALVFTKLQRHIPRCFEEGGAILAEAPKEQLRRMSVCKRAVEAKDSYKLGSLFSMYEYPKEQNDVSVFYAQSFAMCDYLVGLKGRSTLLKFATDGERIGWDKAAEQFYGFTDLDDMRDKWRSWLAKQGPSLEPPILKNRVNDGPDVERRRAPLNESAAKAIPAVPPGPPPANGSVIYIYADPKSK